MKRKRRRQKNRIVFEWKTGKEGKENVAKWRKKIECLIKEKTCKEEKKKAEEEEKKKGKIEYFIYLLR